MNDAMSNDATLHELARQLGDRAAGQLDVERTAEAVLARLRATPAVVVPLWARPAWIRIAATLVVFLGAAVLFRSANPGHPVDHYVAEELNDLSADDLRQILATLDETLDTPGSGTDTEGLDDLNAQQLRELLRALEGTS